MSDLIDESGWRASHVVITGVGKSFIMAQAGASLLRSVGVRAHAIHAIELLHGDMGIIDETTLVVAVSDSGETREVINAIASVDAKHPQIWVVTSHEQSMLARYADLLFDYPVEPGASVHGTIPAGCLHHQLQFFIEWAAQAADEQTREQLAANHPGGTLYERPA